MVGVGGRIGKNFDGDIAVELGIAGALDFPQAAGAGDGENLAGTNTGSGVEGSDGKL
jgi:hypothetical protein